MQAVILAGGLGTRLSEETMEKPKPLVEIGGKPILWHIMKTYSYYGVNDFIICCGYKGYLIKEYFKNYSLNNSDIEFNLQNDSMEIKNSSKENWKILCIDTGSETQTGGRLKRVKDFIKDDTFHFTYGDGVGDINISKLEEFHSTKGTLATVTGVSPPGRFGALSIDYDKNLVIKFDEKPETGNTWINGGYFVLNKKVLDYIPGDQSPFEDIPLKKLTSEKNLSVFLHEGYWQPMDTLREKNILTDLVLTKKAKWMKW
tara:strand:+ start:251 stop:1024 length:774 start_codon:yes stop_codon:yes gene_type:complete